MATTLRSACERCRTRKNRCDSVRPTCTRCSAAGVPCVYPAGSVILSTSTSAPSAAAAAASAPLASVPSSAKRPRLSDSGSPSSSNNGQPASNYAITAQSATNGSGSVEPASAPAANNTLPSHHQYLARLPTLQDLGAILRAGDSENDLDAFGSAFGHPDAAARSSTAAPSPANANTISVQLQSVISRRDLPRWPGEAQMLVDHYLHCTNAAFPILHGPTIQDQVQRVCAAAQSTSEAASTAGNIATFDAAIVLLMFAVSAASMPASTHAAMKAKASDFWKAASKFYPEAKAVKGYQSMQLLHLRLQFLMYAPQYGSVWLESGEAMRTAIDLGIHSEDHINMHAHMPDALERDMNRRLFWTSYCVDRNLSASLGRPPAIHDDWISAEMPSELDDECITPQVLLPGPPSTRKLGAIAHIRIRCFQSEIQNRLYTTRAAREGPPGSEWFSSIAGKIHAWHQSLPQPTGFISTEWYNLNYHMTLTMLFRTCPANATPTHEQTLAAFQSAGAIMRIYKEMLRKSRINYHWLATYHLFTSGVTYLNCLWQADANGWSIVPSYVDALLDIQGCTSVMEALAAITLGTASMRNAFEKISERVIRRLSSRPVSRPPELASSGSLGLLDGPAQHPAASSSALGGASPQHEPSSNGLSHSQEANGNGIPQQQENLFPQMIIPNFDEILLDQSNRQLDDSLRDTLDNWLRLPLGTFTDLDWSYLGQT